MLGRGVGFVFVGEKEWGNRKALLKFNRFGKPGVKLGWLGVAGPVWAKTTQATQATLE